jgi:hypothetical protein
VARPSRMVVPGSPHHVTQHVVRSPDMARRNGIPEDAALVTGRTLPEPFDVG